MSLFSKSIDALEELDLQALIANQVAEGKTLDYKEKLPGNNDDDRKEYLYDVSSFANAAGGFLIIGMKETGGLPIELSGVSVADVDKEKLRLESMLQDGIQPRIAGVPLTSIPLQNGHIAFVMRIPKSWAMPHMVTFKRASRFYSRNSSGKYQLDVQELRAAFVGSEIAAEHIRNFRMERLGKVVADEVPVPLKSSAKIILHLIPFRSFELGTSFNIAQLPQKERLLGPLDAGGWNYRINFDGFLVIEAHAARSTSYGYVQLFRNGCIESVNTSLLSPFNGQTLIPGQSFEEELIQVLKLYVTAQQELGVELPIFVMLSLVGVSGYEIGVASSPLGLRRGQPIDRDSLIIPEIMLEDFEFDPADILRPLFDAVWNAAGWSQSMNYDETGKRKKS